MKIMENYQAGVNLGGWISQYKKFDHEHFKTFIVEDDIRQIASWGMDHVRLPFDYPVLEDDERPFEYKEDGFAYLDNCINWCKKCGLNVILDLHKTPGYFFGTLHKNTLFEDKTMEDRFLNLWRTISRRYAREGDNLMFELLNEMVEPTSDRWNRLAHKAIKAIHEIDSDRYIVYGGNHYNSINELKNIDIVKGNDRIIYTFHFYHPFIFTHQRAAWNQFCRDYNAVIDYPGMCPDLKEFLEANPQYYEWNKFFIDHEMNRDLMVQDMQPAVDFMNSTGKDVYCGEYGVIMIAPLQSRINWHRDFVDITKELKIGRACWTYKMLDFGLVDQNSNVISEELVKVVSTK